jgi:hypothetical protein
MWATSVIKKTAQCKQSTGLMSVSPKCPKQVWLGPNVVQGNAVSGKGHLGRFWGNVVWGIAVVPINQLAKIRQI